MLGKLVVIKGEAKGLSCTIKENEEAPIGRNLQCSLPIPDIKLSRIHCVVRNAEDSFEVLDNNSTNGTYVNEKQVEISTPLKAGDIIRIGDTEIEFSTE